VPPYEELDTSMLTNIFNIEFRHEFAHSFSGKSTITAATRAALLTSVYAPNQLSARASPQTPVGELSALPQNP